MESATIDWAPNDASESADTDGDGVGDNADAFPTDSTETMDTDNDGVGDSRMHSPTMQLKQLIETWME